MFKRILWTIVVLVFVAAIAFGAYCLYQKLTGGDMPFTTDSTITAQSTPVPTTNSNEVPALTEAPATQAPVITEVPATEIPQVTEVPKQVPVLVTEAPAEKNNAEEEGYAKVEDENPNTEVKLLVNNNGNLFAITEKRRVKVEKTVEVNENEVEKLQLKDGRLKNSVEAWRNVEEYITGYVVDYDVKLNEIFTTIEEALENTVMEDENGYAHRLFDESKSGKLIVRIKFVYNKETYALEVWLQEELFTLRKYGKLNVNPPVVTQPPAETVTPPPVVTQPPAETVTPPPVVTQPPAETVTPPPVVTQPPAETVTPPPAVTQPPTVTAIPAVTQPPTVTAIPAVTQPPTMTAVPAKTQLPSVTNVPVVTQPPAVTAAPVEEKPDGVTI